MREFQCFIINSFLFLCFTLNAQRNFNNNWVFGSVYSADPGKGNIAQMVFNDTGIVEVNTYTGPYHITSHTASISDKGGVLKLWTNRCAIFNGNHDTLINSCQLKKFDEGGYCKRNGGSPYSSCTLLLPMPGHEDIYWLFYTNDNSTPWMDIKYQPFTSYLNGALIDFNRNSQGEVAKSWLALYEDTITVSHLTACRHQNGRDWWICTPMDAKPCYAMHTLTDTGYAFHHQQCLGDRYFGTHDAFGQACFSPDGKYYARYYSYYGLHLFRFNDSTGMLSDPVYINNPVNPDIYFNGGVCISPNSKLLYLTCHKFLFQYDLTAPDIKSSAILIDTLDLTTTKTEISDFHYSALGPDGRIYIAGSWGSPRRYLHVINRPNCRGKDCGFVQQAIKLPVDNAENVPNVPHFTNWKDVSPDCSLTVINNPTKPLPQISVYVKDKLLLLDCNDRMTDYQLRIYSVDGIELISKQISNHKESISLNQFPLGFYFVTIENQGLKKSFKIVI